MSDHKETVRQSFARQAEAWSHAPLLRDQEILDRIVRPLGLGEGDSVLDVACGTGILTLAMAERAGRVTGIDITPAMLQKAEAARSARGLHNATFQEGDAERLPFRDGHFSAAVTRLTVHHFPDPPRVLREMVRVVRPGGRVAVADMVASPDPKKAHLHNQIERLRDPSHVTCYAPSELQQMVRDAGVRVEHTDFFSMVRHLREWVAITGNPPEEVAAIRALMLRAADDDAAGIQATLEDDGDVRFVHHWMVIVGRKG